MMSRIAPHSPAPFSKPVGQQRVGAAPTKPASLAPTPVYIPEPATTEDNPLLETAKGVWNLPSKAGSTVFNGLCWALAGFLSLKLVGSFFRK